MSNQYQAYGELTGIVAGLEVKRKPGLNQCEFNYFFNRQCLTSLPKDTPSLAPYCRAQSAPLVPNIYAIDVDVLFPKHAQSFYCMQLTSLLYFSLSG